MIFYLCILHRYLSGTELSDESSCIIPHVYPGSAHNPTTNPSDGYGCGHRLWHGGRISFAFASVVTILPLFNNAVTWFLIKAFLWSEVLPNFLYFAILIILHLWNICRCLLVLLTKYYILVCVPLMNLTRLRLLVLQTSLYMSTNQERDGTLFIPSLL